MTEQAHHIQPIRWGMIGGGEGAFIGAVHRMAGRLDGHYALLAGALSSQPERAVASGRALGLDEDRSYPTWQAMLDGEMKRPADTRIEAVSIVTPNHVHYEPAMACLQAGLAVIIDKPMTRTLEEAEALANAAKKHDAIVAVTYTYSGYPMIQQAREMVRSGQLGEIRKVVVQYWQGWLSQNLAAQGHKQASWRSEPSLAGVGGCIGDIGTHCEQLIGAVTGLRIEAVCADLASLVEGRTIDDDASVLLRLQGDGAAAGARGVLCASQVCIGSDNDLQLRVHGSKGSLCWRQECPDELIVSMEGRPSQVYRRGADSLCARAAAATRLPGGHPEGFIEAFANVYHRIAEAIRAKAGHNGAARFGFPGVEDGLRGVRFVERVVANAHSDAKWTKIEA